MLEIPLCDVIGGRFQPFSELCVDPLFFFSLLFRRGGSSARPSSRFGFSPLRTSKPHVRFTDISASESVNSKSLANHSLLKFSSLGVRQSAQVGRFLVSTPNANIFVTLRSYCSGKEQQKEEKKPNEREEEKVDAPSEPSSSPFASRPSKSEEKSSGASEESSDSGSKSQGFSPDRSQWFMDKNQGNTRVPASKVFTPTYIITINTEKSMFRRLWSGMGLVSFNLAIAIKKWTTKPDGTTPIPEFWKKQIYTARLDALLLMIGICALSGADIFFFLVWITGVIYFPNAIVPSVLRIPSRGEVRAFVYDHLEDLDTEETGLATIFDATRVLQTVERQMTPEVLNSVLEAAGAKDGFVDYERLADVVVGKKVDE